MSHKAIPLLIVFVATSVACRGSSLLSVPAPAGVSDGGSLTGASAATGLADGAIGQFSIAFASADEFGFQGGQVDWTGVFTDEFTAEISGLAPPIPVDARDVSLAGVSFLAPGQYGTDYLYAMLHKARLASGVAAQSLKRYAPSNQRSVTGEVYALAGYAELFLAEDFCSGVPLSEPLPSTGFAYGVPVTTDSLLGHAVTEFDSALAYAAGDPSITELAQVGLARALVDRGRYAEAKTAVIGVSTIFDYSIQLAASGTAYYQTDFYAYLAGSREKRVGERKGGVGLNYISGSDPRLPVDSSGGLDAIGRTFYYPLKFPYGSTAISLANGVEARLIEAEADLAAGDVLGWAQTLNTLRQTAITPAMSSLTPDSTVTASSIMRVDVLFRERAFWLYGTGRRLGDLRRLVRQYGRDQSAVFPSGPYPPHAIVPAAPATYGSDVNFPIQAVEQTNPNFHGCLSRAA